MDKNYQNTPLTTSTTATTTTFSSLESSESDQNIDQDLDFEVSDFFNLETWPGMAEPGSMGFRQNQSLGSQGSMACEVGGTSNIPNEGENSMASNMDTGEARGANATRVAFRMKSEADVVEDGYKWRKYGKKMVKNSPNPRNYYKCSVDNCPVKKRVERDKEDSTYVITTYEGYHNHEAPK